MSWAAEYNALSIHYRRTKGRGTEKCRMATCEQNSPKIAKKKNIRPANHVYLARLVDFNVSVAYAAELENICPLLRRLCRQSLQYCRKICQSKTSAGQTRQWHTYKHRAFYPIDGYPQYEGMRTELARFATHCTTHAVFCSDLYAHWNRTLNSGHRFRDIVCEATTTTTHAHERGKLTRSIDRKTGTPHRCMRIRSPVLSARSHRIHIRARGFEECRRIHESVVRRHWMDIGNPFSVADTWIIASLTHNVVVVEDICDCIQNMHCTQWLNGLSVLVLR